MAVSPEHLYGRWRHAHEEDTDRDMVFRPATAKLPPARGRRGLDLKPDGSYAELRPGPDDRPEERSGRWGVEGDWLVVETEGGASRSAMRIVAADGDAIVVRKLGRE